MSGGLIMLGLSLWERFRSNAPTWLWLCLAIGFVLVAAFLAWKDERVKVGARDSQIVELKGDITRLQTEISQLAEPKLVGTIRQLAVSPEQLTAGITTAVFLVATIRNLGAPSIVDTWNLVVKFPDGREIPAEHVVVPGQNAIRIPSGSGHVVYGSEDALYNKTTTPIGRNDEKTGVLAFLVRGVPFEIVRQVGSTFFLSFKDATGKGYAVAHRSDGQFIVPNFFPGTNPKLETQVAPPQK